MKCAHKNDKQIDFWAEKNWWLSFTKEKNAHDFYSRSTKKSFPLRIFLVNVTNWELMFLCSVNPLWGTSWNVLKIPIFAFFSFYGTFDSFFSTLQFVAFMQHCPTEGVKWSIFRGGLSKNVFSVYKYYIEDNAFVQMQLTINHEISKSNCCLCVKIILYSIFCSNCYYFHWGINNIFLSSHQSRENGRAYHILHQGMV